jgi:dihydrofolate reductase
MSSTVLYMSMSLDGFVAGPNERPDNGLGDGGHRLHDWIFAGAPTEHLGVPGRPPGVNGEVMDEFMSTGAVVAGRGTVEPADYWGGDHHDGVPIFILSRHKSEADAAQWPLVTYVGDVVTAMASAKKAAGGKTSSSTASAPRSWPWPPASSTRFRFIWSRSFSVRAVDYSSTSAPTTSSSTRSGSSMAPASPISATASAGERRGCHPAEALLLERSVTTMTTYTVDWFTTLDGFGSGPEAYWGKDGPELREQRAQTYGNEDQTLVFGANTYRLFQRFAPAEDDPSHSPLNEARKIVISRTLEEPLTWKNSTLIAEDALDAIPRLKEESPVPLRCHGSIAMNRALLAAGLVDRLELMVFPVITGASGTDPILADLPDIDLELVDSQVLDGRMQQLVYVPTVRR